MKYVIEICEIETCFFPPNIALRKTLREGIVPLGDRVALKGKGCTGHCAPFIVVRDSEGNRYMYSNVTEENAKQIIREHIANDVPINGWAMKLSS